MWTRKVKKKNRLIFKAKGRFFINLPHSGFLSKQSFKTVCLIGTVHKNVTLAYFPNVKNV